jgi:hypothetical protein
MYRQLGEPIGGISQPYVRPIKLGKAESATEFGTKLMVSMVENYAFITRTRWDNFNECHDLQDKMKVYKRSVGVYHESVHADRINRSQNNIRYC